jgi:hypothetical protein
VLSGDLAEATPELALVQIDDLSPMAMSAPGLTHHPAGEPLRFPENGAQVLNSCGVLPRTEVSIG